MATKLRKLKITRVAVCPQGANPDADIVLFKSVPSAVEKQGVTVGDVYTDTVVGTPGATAAGTSHCTDPDCDDPDCPVHGALVRARRREKRLAKGPIGEMGLHGEPDGDEDTPLDYATRGQQYDLWETLWAKWQCLCATFTDVTGDWDADNVPHLPIFERSIGQFQADVHQLLVDGGVVEKVAPALTQLTTLAKAGAAMAGHRLTRLKDAIAALQQILAECTPEDCPHGVQPPVDRTGISAADVVGMPGVMKHPRQGDAAMAVRKNTESDQEHCAACHDEDCDHPAHERLKKEESRMADRETALATLKAAFDTTKAELVTAQADLAKAHADLATLQEAQRIAKMSPEEQREALLASMPELVRKSYLDQESRLALIEKTNRDLQEKNERLDYIQKTVEFRHVGFVPDDHWPILKAIDQIPDEAARTELLRLLKAAAAQLQTSPWITTVGTGQTSSSASDGSAEQQLMALAQRHAEEKGVPMDKAIEAVVKAHPDLYQRNMLEKRRTNQVQFGSR